MSELVKLTGRYPPQLAAELRELAAALDEPLWGILALAAASYLTLHRRELRAAVRRRAKSASPALARQAREQYELNLLTKAKARH